METKTTFIQAKPEGNHDKPRRKSARSANLIKQFLRIYQHIAPDKTAEIIWDYFTRPKKGWFNESQKELLLEAETGSIDYRGYRIVTYKWGTHGPKVLLSHGWNSKVADFRRMIQALLKAGFVVEGVDMKAHGHSEGTRTALPEYRDILKHYYLNNGPFYGVIGYSLGGIAAGIALSELPEMLHPEHLIIIAAPPYVRYFFKDMVMDQVGCNHRVYEEMSGLVEKYHGESIDYFDLRLKTEQLADVQVHLVYDENDLTVPFERGLEMKNHFPGARWVHTVGLGHYKVIAHQEVIGHIISELQLEVQELLGEFDRKERENQD